MQTLANLMTVMHPVVQDALVTLRDADTPPEEFRRAATRATRVLAMEALRDTPTRTVTVETPLAPAECQMIAAEIVVVPVLRAGLGMLDAILDLVPSARVGHLGLQRDEATAVASEYYRKLPKDLAACIVLLIDPMLATGGSADAALDMLVAAGARDIRMLSLVTAPEGLALLGERHPMVTVYAPGVDSHLNEHKYIVPGLGDFGDRLYGTL